MTGRPDPARSTGNRARKAYPDEVRERALEVMRVDGLAAAHEATGVPKATLSRWGRDAGVDLGAAVERSRAASSARAAQLADTTVGRLEYILDLSTTVISRHMEALADVAELDDDDLGRWSAELGRFIPPDDRSATSKALRRQQLLASSGVPLRDLVGVTTRAIHDLQLLRGEATERGEVSVSFAVPRPDPSTVVVVQQEDLSQIGPR